MEPLDDRIKAYLQNNIERTETVIDTCDDDPNSYNAGYLAGKLAALKDTQNFIARQPD
jgi:hypothetical protein